MCGRRGHGRPLAATRTPLAVTRTTPAGPTGAAPATPAARTAAASSARTAATTAAAPGAFASPFAPTTVVPGATTASTTALSVVVTAPLPRPGGEDHRHVGCTPRRALDLDSPLDLLRRPDRLGLGQRLDLDALEPGVHVAWRTAPTFSPGGTSDASTVPLGWRAPAARQVQDPSPVWLVSSMSIRRDMRRTRYLARARGPDTRRRTASPNMERPSAGGVPSCSCRYLVHDRRTTPPREESSMSEDTEQPGSASAAGEPVAPATPTDPATTTDGPTPPSGGDAIPLPPPSSDPTPPLGQSGLGETGAAPPPPPPPPPASPYAPPSQSWAAPTATASGPGRDPFAYPPPSAAGGTTSGSARSHGSGSRSPWSPRSSVLWWVPGSPPWPTTPTTTRTAASPSTRAAPPPEPPCSAAT